MIIVLFWQLSLPDSFPRRVPSNGRLDFRDTSLSNIFITFRDLVGELREHAGVERVWTMGWPFWTKRRLRGFRFAATDVDWTAGNLLDATGPVAALLLLFTGRCAALPQLSGAGVDELPEVLRR